MKQDRDSKGDNKVNLNPIKANMTELSIGTHLVLFSYRTPVACLEAKTGTLYRTQKKWSNTTTRHINQWVASNSYEIDKTPSIISKPQEFFDNLIAGVK
jgi:hypothetical protein